MKRLDSSLFDWLTWRNGNPLDVFDLPCRTSELTSSRGRWLLREHAVGWCPAESVPCRPKVGQIAVMFFKDGNLFWFHLRKHEVVSIWK